MCTCGYPNSYLAHLCQNRADGCLAEQSALLPYEGFYCVGHGIVNCQACESMFGGDAIEIDVGGEDGTDCPSSIDDAYQVSEMTVDDLHGLYPLLVEHLREIFGGVDAAREL